MVEKLEVGLPVNQIAACLKLGYHRNAHFPGTSWGTYDCSGQARLAIDVL